MLLAENLDTIDQYVVDLKDTLSNWDSKTKYKGEDMARGINKVILIGNLGADPDVRFTQAGGAVANLRLATSESWKDKATGEAQERTEWHRIVLFGRLGEIAKNYLKKGSKIYVEGRLQTRKWQDQNGQDRYTTEIVCNELQMLDSLGEHSSTEKLTNQDKDVPNDKDDFPEDDIPF